MIKPISILFALIIIFSGCSKEESNLTDSKNVETRKFNDFGNFLDNDVGCVKEQIRTTRLESKDRLKYTIGKFLALKFEDANFKSEFLDLIVQSPKKNTVFLVDLMGANFSGEDGDESFEDLLDDFYGEHFASDLDLLNTICGVNWDVVVQLPWWGEEVILENSENIHDQNFSFIPAIEPVVCDGENVRIAFQGTEEFVVFTDKPIIGNIPIYIKEVEHFSEYDLDSDSELMHVFTQINSQYGNCTFTIQDMDDFVKSIDCANLQVIDLIAFMMFAHDHCTICGNGMVVTGGDDDCEEICDNGLDDNGDGYIDCDDMMCDCIEICGNGLDDDQDGEIDEIDCIEESSGEICGNYIDDDGDGLIDYEDEIDCPCEKTCQRDCIVESNVLKGVKFDQSAFNYVCQLKEETHILLKYTFKGVSLCSGDYSDDCPRKNIQTLEVDKDFAPELPGETRDFFELQKEGEVHVDDAVEYEIDVGLNGIVYVGPHPSNDNYLVYWKAYPKYVPVNWLYMSGNAQNNWNGDIIGNSVDVSVYELDTYSQVSTETTSTSTRVSNTFNLAYNAGISLFKLAKIGLRASYTFSNTVTNAQTETLVTRFDNRSVWKYLVWSYSRNLY
jgi:hypothetical protein